MPALTSTLLVHAIPGASHPDEWAGPLSAACQRFQITKTVRRMAAFLGHIAHESGSLRKLEENLNYTDPSRINKIFKAIRTDEEAKAYVSKPEALANHAYANRSGNGNEASGDGWRYRGRGLIQLTFKGNYAALAKDLKVDFVKQPELLATREYAALSAAWFWNKHGLNELADTESYVVLSRRINKKLDGFPAREANRKRALNVLCGAVLATLAGGTAAPHLGI